MEIRSAINRRLLHAACLTSMLLMACLALLPATAVSQTGQPAKHDAEKYAEESFEKGLDFARQGKFELALIEFQAAYEVLPTPEVLFNIASCLKELSRFTEAIAGYEQFLKQAPDDTSAGLIDDAKKSIEELSTYVGRLRISCDQETAEVIIDGKNFGTLPREEPYILDIGPHYVTIIKQGFINVTKKVIVRPGMEEDMTVSLQEIKSFGRLSIETHPEDGFISVDGAEKGQGKWEGFLSEGNHKIEVYKKDFELFSCKAYIKKDELNHQDFYLLKSPAPSRLTLSINVPDVTAVLDGSKSITLPYNSGGLSQGKHSLSINKAGYHEIDEDFISGSAQDIRISAVLKKKKPSQAWFWTSAVLSLASLGTGLGLHLKARDIYWDRQQGGYSRDEIESMGDEGEQYMNASIGMYAVGGALAAAAVILYFFVDFRPEKSSLQTTFSTLEIPDTDDCRELSDINEKLGDYD